MFGSSRSGASLDERVVGMSPWGDWETSSLTSAGVRVSPMSAMQTLAVYGCVGFIADGISTLPVDVFRGDGRGRETVRPPRWLTNPTADLDFISWCTQVLVSLLIDGNFYAHKRYEGVSLSEVVPLDPSTVDVQRIKGRKTYLINGKPIDSFEIMHVPGIMFPGRLVGLSPLEAARQTIGRTVAVEDFAAKFFSQGATMSGVIEDPAPADAAKARETARIFGRLHSGNKRAHLPGVLMGGATWKSTGVTNEQAQFLETHQFTQAQIASFMFRIDPTEFGVSISQGSSLTYANLVQRNQRKVQVTYLPWIVRLEKAISALLPKPQYVKFNVDGLLRAEAKTRFEMYEIAQRVSESAVKLGEPPLLSTDEMRAFEDWAPYDGPALSAPADSPSDPQGDVNGNQD